MTLSNIFHQAHQLYLGTNFNELIEHPTFIYTKSFFDNAWYNYLVPKTDNPQLLNQEQITSVIKEQTQKGKQLSWYVHTSILPEYNDFLKDSPSSLIGSDTYMVADRNSLLPVTLPEGYALSTEYHLSEIITCLQACFPDWPGEKIYCERYEQYKKQGQPHRLFETFCIKFNKQIVAAASVSIDQKLNLGYLHNAGVLLEHRRKGLHTALMNARINHAIQNKITRFLTVLEENGASFHSFKKAGFQAKDKFVLYQIQAT